MKRGDVLQMWKAAGGLIEGESLDQLSINMDQLWPFLIEYEMARFREATSKKRQEEEARQRRFDSYMPGEVEWEMHNARCQKKRLGREHACSCQIGMNRRRTQVENAAKANDLEFLKTLGNMEAFNWHEARKLVDKTHKNPYKDR